MLFWWFWSLFSENGSRIINLSKVLQGFSRCVFAFHIGKASITRTTATKNLDILSKLQKTLKTLGEINVSGKRMSRKVLRFPGNSGRPLVKQWICDLDISSGNPGERRNLWIPVATPCKTLGKQGICSASHRVHGSGVAGITGNLMISRNHWKTLWKWSFCELDTAGFQLTLTLS